MKTKRRTKIKSLLPIPDDWNGEDWLLGFICVPDSTLWRSYVSGQIYGLTRGRAWDGETGSIKGAQEIGRLIFESVYMTNMTELAEAITAIASAISSEQRTIDVDVKCGCCSGGSGTSGSGGSPADETEIEFDGENAPDGFDSVTEFNAYRCAVATQIQKDMLSDVQTWQSFIWTMSTVAVIGQTITALTPIPGDEIVWFIGAMTVAITTGGLVSPLLAEAEDVLANHKDDIICAMLRGGNVGSVTDDLRAELWQAVQEDVGAGNQSLVYGVLKMMTWPDNLNRLFEMDGTRDYPDATCNCTDGLVWLFVEDDEGWTYTDESDPAPANSAVMAYEASTEALRVSHVVVSGAHQESRIECDSPVISVAPGPFQMTVNFGAPSDGVVVGVAFLLHYESDPSEHYSMGTFDSQDMKDLSIITTDTVVGVTVVTVRATGNSGGPWAFTTDILDVAIAGNIQDPGSSGVS